MPRIRGVNISRTVRTMLRNNRPLSEIVEEARRLSPNPHTWNADRVLHIQAAMVARDTVATQPNVARVMPRAPAPQPNRETRRAMATTVSVDPNFTFGVEIECFSPVGLSATAHRLEAAGVECYQEGYNHSTRTYWKIITDGSLNYMEGFHAMEIVSPVLKGQAGLDQLKKVCDLLVSMGCKVNKSCGLHVHHQVTARNTNMNPAQVMKNAIYLYHKWQGKFNAILPRSRRNAYYARSYSRSDIQFLNQVYTTRDLQRVAPARYRVVNPRAYWSHGTLEFRQHSGTVEYEKILNWIVITQAIMARSRALTTELTTSIMQYAPAQISRELGLSPDLVRYMKVRATKFRGHGAAAEAA